MKLIALLSVLVLLLVGGISCSNGKPIEEATSTIEPEASRSEFLSVSGRLLYAGETSLEERIAKADVIARATLRSATGGKDRLPEYGQYAVKDVPVMQFSFNVLEYLKGTGDAQITAVVWEFDPPSSFADDRGTTLLSERDTRWDGREAIIFLEKWDIPNGGIRYVLGSVRDPDFEEIDWPLWDHYSISSDEDRRWLPAAAAAASGASGTSQRFLLEPPGPSGGSGASGQSGPETITLQGLKNKVTAIGAEIAKGNGTEAYQECISLKYEREREVNSDTTRGRAIARYERYDETIASGQPPGTQVHDIHASDPFQDYYALLEPTKPDDLGETRLLGRDARLFTPVWRGLVHTARPLPTGEYKFFHNPVPPGLAPCDGQPDEVKYGYEIFVTVTAPDGTLHEAFFDPVSSGDAVGHFGTGDTLKPATFTTGDLSTTVHSLKWQDSAVTLGLQPYNTLAGQILDFITGDGTTSLSLEASAATGDSTAGTLTWALGSQPWSSGDQLMLRIRDSNTPPTFAEDTYTFSVAESTSAFTVIGTVKAVDQDGDTVLHKITGGNDGGRFSIDGWEGFILVKGRLDYESKSSYELTVTGTDPGGRSATTTVTINVTDVAE